MSSREERQPAFDPCDLRVSRIRSCFKWLLLTGCLFTALPSAAAFIVTGSGVALTSSENWVAGETVDLSFSYDLSSFADDTDVATERGLYEAVAPIPLTVTGSVSGTISSIGSIFRAIGINDGPVDVFRFENVDAATQRVGTGFNKQDVSLAALLIDPPASFSALHAVVFPSVAAENPWVSTIATFVGQTNTDLILNSFQWTITEEVSTVPVPAAAWLFGSGLIGLMSVARRRSDQHHTV